MKKEYNSPLLSPPKDTLCDCAYIIHQISACNGKKMELCKYISFSNCSPSLAFHRPNVYRETGFFREPMCVSLF